MWSEAAQRNSAPILTLLREVLHERQDWRVLEIGSGTGQHAMTFSDALPHVQWQTSDLEVNIEGIRANLKNLGNERIKPPLIVNAKSIASIEQEFDAVYTANTCHIMSWDNVKLLLANVASLLKEQGLFIVYGPFNVGGLPSADSNYRFDQYLRLANPHQGIRHREDVCWIADAHGLSLTGQHNMPTNNQMLVFEKRRSGL